MSMEAIQSNISAIHNRAHFICMVLSAVCGAAALIAFYQVHGITLEADAAMSIGTSVLLCLLDSLGICGSFVCILAFALRNSTQKRDETDIYGCVLVCLGVTLIFDAVLLFRGIFPHSFWKMLLAVPLGLVVTALVHIGGYFCFRNLYLILRLRSAAQQLSGYRGISYDAFNNSATAYNQMNRRILRLGAAVGMRTKAPKTVQPLSDNEDFPYYSPENIHLFLTEGVDGIFGYCTRVSQFLGTRERRRRKIGKQTEYLRDTVEKKSSALEHTEAYWEQGSSAAFSQETKAGFRSNTAGAVQMLSEQKGKEKKIRRIR